MNVLPFIFTILLVLSFTTALTMQNRILGRKNQKAHIGLKRAELEILRSCEKEQFNTLPGAALEKIEVKTKTKHSSPSSKKEAPPLPPVNPACARLNLYPLVEKGKEEEEALYQMAAKLLRLFYANMLEEKKEFQLLDTILAAAKLQIKEGHSFPLETLVIGQDQYLYYVLLKGTKNSILGQKGYPSLLDYFKIERADSKICLFHAHPHMIAVFFGLESAIPLFAELHQEKKAGMDLEAILQFVRKPELALVDENVWKLVDFRRPNHGKDARQTFIASDEESKISVRKDVMIR